MATKNKKLEIKVAEIVAVKNKQLAPYLGIFNFVGKNISQKQLGSILGFFNIADRSKDSAYLVNFLKSVIRRKYFQNTKKSSTDSFEFAISKINLSLSEIAKHGSVDWVGKINTVICAISENEINFTVCGNAKILLLRDNKLTEITTGMAPSKESISPLKTFTDIAGGKIQKGDKLLLIDTDIEKIVGLANLEYYITSFSQKKFIRFLKTAMINKLATSGALIIEIKEEVYSPTKKKNKQKGVKENDKVNLFSNKLFKKTTNITPKQANVKHSSKNNLTDKKSDEKIGHIYLKDTAVVNTKTVLQEKVSIFKENCLSFFFALKNRHLKKIDYYRKKHTKRILISASLTLRDIFRKTTKLKQKLVIYLTTKKKEKKKEIIVAKKISKPTGLTLQQKIAEKKRELLVIKKSKEKNDKSASRLTLFELKKLLKRCLYSINKVFEKVLPNFNKLKLNLRRMDNSQRLLALFLIFLIFIIPLFFSKLRKKQFFTKNASIKMESQEQKTGNNISTDGKNYTAAINLYQGENIIAIIVNDDEFFVIQENKLISIKNSNSREVNFPNNFGSVKLATFMADLNLIFIIDESNKLLSYSPISRKFIEDNIDFPSNAEISEMGTYLTYLYTVDTRHNQIYRYPRAVGGFGDRKNWLKDTVELGNVSGVAIDGDIFLVQAKKLYKMTKGKVIPINIDEKRYSINKIFTNDELKHLYIIDSKNNKLLKLSKDGNVLNAYANPELSESNSLFIDSSETNAYFTTPNTLFKIKIN